MDVISYFGGRATGSAHDDEQQNSAQQFRIPALDGIRCLAIVAVMLGHLDIPELPSLGWAGVNLFFVLSGFLITAILLRTRSMPRYFLRFYVRRALRIFPIYFLVLILLIALYALQGKQLQASLWYIGYVQNFPLGLTFESHREFPFSEWYGHTWSLAVEEQFYLLWPLAVWLLPTPKLLKLCLLIVLSAAPFRLVAGPVWQTTFNWTLLFGQMDQLAIGASLAILISGELDGPTIRHTFSIWLFALGAMILLIFVPYEAFVSHGISSWFVLLCGAIAILFGVILGQSRKELLSSGAQDASGRAAAHAILPLAGTGILLIVGICSEESNDFRWSETGQWLLTLMALFFAFLIYQVITVENWFSRVLATAPLAYIGRISYGLYIYHGLVYHFIDLNGDQQLPLELSRALKIGITFALAAASFHFLERPILSIKNRI